jgi:hypothetical protein
MLRSVIRGVLSAVCVLSFGSAAAAAPVTFSGFFDDPTNTALVASDLTSPLFGNDDEIANNVALYTLNLPVGGIVTFESVGFAAGGAEPYLTLFTGTGPGATFLDSSFFIPDIDFTLARNLAAGNYTVAIGVYLNMSFAENTQDPAFALSDGFIGLGVPGGLGNSYYQVNVTAPLPEPSTVLMIGLGMAAVTTRRRRRSLR